MGTEIDGNGCRSVIRHAATGVVVLVGVLVSSHIAWTAAEEHARANGRSFSVPVPDGFVIFDAANSPQIAAMIAAGGVVLIQKEKAAIENAYRAHIVVSAAYPPGKIDLQDKETCEMVGYRGAGSVGGTLEIAGIAQLPTGPHCQYTVRYLDNPNRAATSTLFSTSEETWLVTCNIDTRDAPAISACSQVVNGWKFTQ